MVCGTGSDVGKTTVVAGLARLLARRGTSVAPFKAQNMALNSFVTACGHEISRAQAFQATAAGVEPDVAMNPVLLKPTGERTAQVVVTGRPVGEMTATEYERYKPELFPLVLDALAGLRARYDVVLVEGAGSPTEINLLTTDLANLRLADAAGLPAIVVGDIDRGGVFAALYGTVALLPDAYRRRVRGFVVNKLRGDPTLLGDAGAELEAACGVPTIGVLPWVVAPPLDGEDSVGLAHRRGSTAPAVADALDVAVLALPRLANYTDLDPLWIEPGVHVRFVGDAAGFGRPDLVIVPGTKATVDDLRWLRAQGLADCLERGDTTVLGICGGYQLLGDRIEDPVESRVGTVEGLGLLPVETRFEETKVTRRRTGTALGCPIAGYQIHHGRVRPRGGDPFVVLDDGDTIDGVQRGACLGSTMHGLFDADEFRARFLEDVAARAGKRFVPAGVSFAAERQARIDRFADVLAEHLDLGAVDRLLADG
jgi:adenosylcobyric acid synthase